MRLIRVAAWSILCLLAVASGCTKHGCDVTLSGNVTLNGVPVEAGEIRFEPRDGKGATAGAVIADGTYTAIVPCGAKTVHISGLKKVGEHAAYPGVAKIPKFPTWKPVGELSERYDIVQTDTKDFQLKPVK